METLTEPGVLPLSHKSISPCGFYPKQDSAPYYYSNPSPSRPGYRSFPGYHQVSEDNTWTRSQNTMPQPYYSREEERQNDGNKESGPYGPSSHAQSISQHPPSSFHHQFHQSQHHTLPVSMPPYSHDYHSSLSRERNQREDIKNFEEGNNSLNKLSNAFSSRKLKSTTHGSDEHQDFSRLDHSSSHNDSMYSSHYSYNKRNNHGEFMDDNRRTIYYQRDVPDALHSVKKVYTSDTVSVISYSQSNVQPAVPEEEHLTDTEEADHMASNEFKTKMNNSSLHLSTIASVMITKESQRDKERQPCLEIIPSNPTYRRGMEYPVSNSDGKLADFYKMKDTPGNNIMTGQHFFQEKRTVITTESFASSLRNKQNDDDSLESPLEGKQDYNNFALSVRGKQSDTDNCVSSLGHNDNFTLSLRSKQGENDKFASFVRGKQSDNVNFVSSLESKYSDNINIASPLRDIQDDTDHNGLHSIQKNTLTSPDSYHKDGRGHLSDHTTSLKSKLQCHTPQEVVPSPTKCDPERNLQSPDQNDSRLYAFTPGKSASSPASVEHRFSDEDTPSSSWLPTSTSSPLPHLKQPQKRGFDEDIQEQSHTAKGSREMMECKESPENTQKIMASNSVSMSQSTTQPPHLSKNLDSPTEPDAKLSLSHRLSLDRFSKTNSSEDGSLDAKREIFSDEGEDDSACEESLSHSPTFSPFNDASTTYPPHFPHPFYQSQSHGPFSGLRFPFGSFQGHPDTSHPGTGFPFGSMPGGPQDMALMGHMHSSRPPFVGPVTSSMGPGRMMTREKDVYFCHLCSYSGKSKPEFDIHMNTHFEFNCPHCDYTSRTEGRLKRHIKDFHTDDSSRRSMPGRPKVYKCKQCPFSATEKDKFWAHSRTHIKEDKLLQCPKCPFVTEYKHHLEYHLRNHFGSKPFKCPKCNYSCVNKSMLNSHMKSHTNVYQYRCSECTYATKYCHSLKLHLKKYNHKPATVLNQDGSLPQGLDAESSGLSIVSKRGPPRGPRGTRKDKNDPYLSHLLEMSPIPLGLGAINPILNGMMPFWPMLPQGHPSPQPGMLSGIRHLAQQAGIRSDHRGESFDDSKTDDTIGDINENSSEESNKKDDDKICRLCSFTAESREALVIHLMQTHKEVPKEVFRSWGFNETYLLELFQRVSSIKRVEHKQISEPHKESDNNQVSSAFNNRDSSEDFPCKENLESSQVSSNHKEASVKTSPTSWWPFSYSDYQNDGSRPQEVYYPLTDNNSENENNTCDSNNGMDILQQMTLKFGSGALTDKMIPLAREDHKEHFEEPQELRKGNIQHFSQTPLDLTKSKSVSPPYISSSTKQEETDGQVDIEEGSKLSSPAEELKFQYPETKTSAKRLMEETEEASNSNGVSISEMSSVVPRKRARKGKAYKLDTLCLKLQKRQIDTQDDAEQELSTECNFHNFKYQQAIIDSEHKNTSKIYSFSTRQAESCRSIDNNSFDISSSDIKQTEENNDMATLAENGSAEEKYDTETVNNHKEESEKNHDTIKMTETNEDVKNEELSTITENKILFQEDAYFELQNMQKDLNILNQGSNSSSLESTNADTNDKGKQLEYIHSDEARENYQIENKSCEATVKEQMCTDADKESGAKISTLQPSKEHSDGDKMDQAEMINTVLENRKKLVPPEVRRGTELAWKLLNDPINPVTTLPLPVEALTIPQSSKTSSGPQGSPIMLPEFINAAAMRKDIKQHSLLPQYPHFHHSQTPQPHLPSVSQHHHPHMPHNSHSSLHSQTSQIHHQHIPPPLMTMKPLLSIPIPSTPMAFIPPTNRMMSEPALTSPSSRMKASQKELYECTYCDLSFRDCVMYTVHMGYHSNQNPFQCNSCGVVSRDKVEFFLHIARSPHA